ncbi:MAG: alpha/beta fold hydrolase [Gemmatimonadales bacterium]|nr:alpha/beta fold hydrolase [Gemmatimonadales bacterium]
MNHMSLVLLAIGTARGTNAQGPPETRTFMLRSGSDTIAVEQIQLEPRRVRGEMLYRTANQRWHFDVALDPNGWVISFDSELRLAADPPEREPRQRARLDFVGDSVFVTVNGAAAPSQRIGTQAGAVPFVNPSFGLVELVTRRVARLGSDSVSIPGLAIAGGVTFPIIVKRIPGDSMVLTLGGVVARLAVDKEGAILGGAVAAQGLTIEVSAGVRGGALLAERPDYSAPSGAPYRAEPVKVPTPMGHTLAGTLTLPSGARGPVPAIVTITGSGSQDRDEDLRVVKGYRLFREIADALSRRGIAVLRMDDRGYGESGGDARTATSRDYADDIRAGLAYLRTRPEIDGRRLGLVGHSEGGLIGPLVAGGDSTLKGIVLMAGPAYTGRRILEFQNKYAIDRSPSIPAASRDSALRVAMIAVDSLGRTAPWMKFFLDYDPLVTANQVKVPTLILQGATDRQVTAEQAALLKEAMEKGGNRDVTAMLFPETNHLFLADPSGDPAGYSRLPSGAIRPEVTSALVEWLVRRLRPAATP